jgi:hypothetical protein
MNDQTLIINLIQQDLKHSQLIYGLAAIGLDGSDLHFLALMEIVAELMEVPQGKINDAWGHLYTELMKGATRFEITSKGEALKSYANSCYQQLKAVLD